MKTTPLHQWHLDSGANMADFGGYEMPLWYPAGIKEEHMSVLLGAGTFDTSHMAAVIADGPDSFDLLQKCFSKDLNRCVGLKKTPISSGRCVYGVFLTEAGEVIDDAIVSKMDDNLYMVVINAGMGGAIAAHLEANKNTLDVKVTDMTDCLGKMDIQGPASAKILSKVLKNPEAVFEKFPYFSFKGHFDAGHPKSKEVQLLDGTPIILSRTGYTGEFGFEMFIKPDKIVSLWKDILAAGSEYGIQACGLGARDSLRAGAVLPLSHQDIGPWPFANTPWPFALPMNDEGDGFSKEFNGSAALLALENPEYTHAFAGTSVRKVPSGEKSEVVDSDGNVIGTILTCATDMGIGRVDGKIVSITSPDRPEDFKPKGLACGFVKVSRKLSLGEEITLREGKRKIQVEVVNDVRPHRSARKPVREML